MENRVLKRGIYISMLIGTFFTVGKRWKQLRHPSADEWTDKMWYIHAREYYSALKRKKV